MSETLTQPIMRMTEAPEGNLPSTGLPPTGLPLTDLRPWVQVVPHLDPKYGGMSAAVPELAQALADGVGGQKVPVALAGFCAPDEHFRPHGFSARQLSYWPLSRKLWLQDQFQGKALRTGFRDLVRGSAGLHIHGLWEQSTSIAAAEAHALKVPYLLSAHGMLEPWALANKRLKKVVYAALVERANVGRARCLHALTLAEAQHFRTFGARSPIAVIPNAVEIPAQTDTALFLQQWPELAGKRIVLFMARLHPKKGLDLLLEAWAAIAPQFPQAHLVIAGPDSEGTQARLQQLAADRQIQHSLSFVGMLRGAMKWSALAAAEAFVLPSFSEGLSVGVLEAMGMGLPVIVTEPCNMPEVQEQSAGWTIQPDLSQLTTALTELLHRDPLENADSGVRGAALIHTRYTWPVVARQMTELYHWVAGGSRPVNVSLMDPA